MSLRRKKISIPPKVNVTLNGDNLKFEGPKGNVDLYIPQFVCVNIRDGFINVQPEIQNLKKARSLAGLICKEIANNLVAVLNKIEYRLELRGVGYRAQMKGKQLELSLGFSHPNILTVSNDLNVSVQGNTEIIIEGMTKNSVGQFAAEIRRLRPPEPYKGKGVFYKGEKIILKPGKSGK
jgi:large subunit ribosomal protein L6